MSQAECWPDTGLSTLPTSGRRRNVYQGEGEGEGERGWERRERVKKRGRELEKERAESVQAYGEKQETEEKNPEFDSKT